MKNIKLIITILICVFLVVLITGIAFLVGYVDLYGFGGGTLELNFNMIFQFFLKGIVSLKVMPVLIVLLTIFFSGKKRFLNTDIRKFISLIVIFAVFVTLMHIAGKQKAEHELIAINNYFSTEQPSKNESGLKYVFIEYGNIDKPLKAEGFRLPIYSQPFIFLMKKNEMIVIDNSNENIIQIKAIKTEI